MKSTTFNDFKEKLDSIVSDKRYSTERDVVELLKTLGLDPPEAPQYPDISPTPWYLGRAIQEPLSEPAIFGEDSLRICKLSQVNHEANKTLILAAPGLMKALCENLEMLVEARRCMIIGNLAVSNEWLGAIDATIRHSQDILKAAGVKLDTE